MAINMFLKSAVRNNVIPFDVKRNTPNEDTRAALAEYKAMKDDPKAYPRYRSYDEMLDMTFEQEAQ